jgi:hypothetical protein
MPFNQPLPLSGKDPDSVPLEEAKRELEAAERDPMGALRAQRARRNQKELERDREDLKERWLAAGSTEDEFEKAWPDLRKEQIRHRAEEADARARAESFRQTVREF